MIVYLAHAPGQRVRGTVDLARATGLRRTAVQRDATRRVRMRRAAPIALTQGVRAMSGRNILPANGVGDTVRHIIDILDGRLAALGAAGRHAVEAAHQWTVTLRTVTLRMLHRRFGETSDIKGRTPAGQAA